MRPDRIGAIPIVISTNTVSDTTSAQSQRLSWPGSSLGASAITDPNGVNKMSAPVSGFYGDIGYCTWATNSNYTITGATVSVCTGIFLNPVGLQNFTNDPLPLYVRIAMSASLAFDYGSPSLDSGEDTERPPMQILPIIARRSPGLLNPDPPDGAGAGGVLHKFSVLPADVYQYIDGHASDNIHPFMYCSVNDTFLLASEFTRYSGSSFNAGDVFGVGFVIRRQDVRRDMDIWANSQFMVSAWIYTSDIDCHDPQRS